MFVVFSLLIASNVGAQAPKIQWQKCLGGSLDDKAYVVQQTSDYGYVVVGHSTSVDGDVATTHNNPEYWIVKLSSVGSIQWQKSFGGSHYDVARSVQQTTDGGYIIAGESHSSDGDVFGYHFGTYDFWLVKLDAIGNIQWSKCFGGEGGGYGDEHAYTVQQTSDGGYIVAGDGRSNDGR